MPPEHKADEQDRYDQPGHCGRPSEQGHIGRGYTVQPEKPIRSGLPGRLLPLIRNLISNTVIVGANLSVSSVLAASSLHFLVVIHKLEYFAHVGVMGGHIRCTGMGTFGGHADHGSRSEE